MHDIGSYSCLLVVHSRGYAYEGKYYYDNLDKFIEKLEMLDLTLLGKAELKQDFGDEYLVIEGGTMGHVTVSGRLVENSGYPQCLEFAFRTDQTCLSAFVNELKSVPRD